MKPNEIHALARMGDVESLRRAIQAGANINEKDEFGSTPLGYTIAQKNVEKALLLLNMGADVTSQDNDGLTVLHSAIEHKLPTVLKALVERCPEAVSISDKHGNQPLWTAAFNARGDYEMVSMLLQHGASPYHRNKVNLCPLDIAKRKGELALLQLLESAGQGPAKG